MPKVCIINGDVAYHKMFNTMGWSSVHNPKDADVIQFTGGADVSPQLYGEALHPTSQCNLARDDREKEIYDKWRGKKHLAGICRGGQFLNVMAGGSMYQHHSGHPSLHEAWVYADMLKVLVSSTHHQIMRPAREGIVLMGAAEGVLAERMNGDAIVREPPEYETEAVHYPDLGVLCFQPHPEFAVRDKRVEDCMSIYFKFLEELMR